MENKMNKLTVAIPTCNRAIAVDSLLDRLFSYMEQGLSFDIFVCDNASLDSTEHVVKKWMDKIPTLSYYRQEKNVGADANFLTCYMTFTTPYLWLLGDTRMISYNEMRFLLNELDKGYDAFILCCHPLMRLPFKMYTDINNLLSEQGWHITNMASCIVSQQFAVTGIYERYLNTNFIQLGGFIEYLSRLSSFKVEYINHEVVYVKELKVEGFDKKMTSWSSKTISICAMQWYMIVMSLPNNINLSVKEKILMDHARYNSILSSLFFIVHVADKDMMFINEFKRYKKYLKFVSAVPMWKYNIIMHTAWIWRILKRIYDKIYKYKNR
ncbi:glycosyltransferase family 2 protein [Bacteroides gallinarum]|uniref:glycosyltransferase family 2 protein n=1 Tax=Bacteroides gallinarum TaxID=376806 RepID=UPI00036FF028|nr:glycosyltransferase family 2 protein [Bacteroides gallinarum]